MARYLISFDRGWMTFPEEDLPDVAKEAHAVIQKAKDARSRLPVRARGPRVPARPDRRRVARALATARLIESLPGSSSRGGRPRLTPAVGPAPAT